MCVYVCTCVCAYIYVCVFVCVQIPLCMCESVYVTSLACAYILVWEIECCLGEKFCAVCVTPLGSLLLFSTTTVILPLPSLREFTVTVLVHPSLSGYCNPSTLWIVHYNWSRISPSHFGTSPAFDQVGWLSSEGLTFSPSSGIHAGPTLSVLLMWMSQIFKVVGTGTLCCCSTPSKRPQIPASSPPMDWLPFVSPASESIMSLFSISLAF